MEILGTRPEVEARAAAAGGHSAAAGAAVGGGGGAGGGGRRGGGATAGGRARRVGALGARGREGGGDGDTEAGAPAERRRALDPAGVPVSARRSRPTTTAAAGRSANVRRRSRPTAAAAAAAAGPAVSFADLAAAEAAAASIQSVYRGHVVRRPSGLTVDDADAPFTIRNLDTGEAVALQVGGEQLVWEQLSYSTLSSNPAA